MRYFSPETRAKLSAAARARWARVHAAGGSSLAFDTIDPPSRSSMSPEGRARLSELMKARWAARRKAEAEAEAETAAPSLMELFEAAKALIDPAELREAVLDLFVDDPCLALIQQVEEHGADELKNSVRLVLTEKIMAVLTGQSSSAAPL